MKAAITIIVTDSLKNRIDAVIFDMDGLLIDTESVGMAQCIRACATLGFTFTKEMYIKIIGVTKKDSEVIVMEMLGDSFPLDDFDRIFREYREDYYAENAVKTMPGAYELLDVLDGVSSIKKALATSTYEQLAEKRLKSAELHGRFDACVFGDMIQNGKPAPDIFLKAAEMLDRKSTRLNFSH